LWVKKIQMRSNCSTIWICQLFSWFFYNNSAFRFSYGEKSGYYSIEGTRRGIHCARCLFYRN
jgi:hypothetical protein